MILLIRFIDQHQTVWRQTETRIMYRPRSEPPYLVLYVIDPMTIIDRSLHLFERLQETLRDLKRIAAADRGISDNQRRDKERRTYSFNPITARGHRCWRDIQDYDDVQRKEYDGACKESGNRSSVCIMTVISRLMTRIHEW